MSILIILIAICSILLFSLDRYAIQKYPNSTRKENLKRGYILNLIFDKPGYIPKKIIGTYICLMFIIILCVVFAWFMP